MDFQVQAVENNERLYNFELNLQEGFDDLRQQLENQYGLPLDAKEKFVEWVNINFGGTG